MAGEPVGGGARQDASHEQEPHVGHGLDDALEQVDRELARLAASLPTDCSLTVTAEPYVHRLAYFGTPGLKLGTYPEPRQTPVAAEVRTTATPRSA